MSSNESKSSEGNRRDNENQTAPGNSIPKNGFRKSDKSRGRPKGSKNRKTIVKQVASEEFTIAENGKKRRRTVLEIILLQLRKQAIEEKNTRAFKLWTKFETVCCPGTSGQPVGYMLAPADLTPEEFIEEMERLDAIRNRQRAEIPEIIR